MLKFTIPKRRSVIYTMIWSYVGTLLVPIIIAGFMQAQSVNLVKNQVNLVNMSVLKQFQKTVDNEFLSINNLWAQISLNPDINVISSLKNVPEVNDKINIYNLIPVFRRHIINNQFIQDCYVYFKDIDLVLSHKGTATLKDIYLSICEGGKTEYGPFEAFNNNNHPQDFTVWYVKDNNNTFIPTMVFSHAASPIIGGRSNTLFVVTISSEKLKQSIAQAEWLNHGMIYIIDGEKNVLFSTKEHNPAHDIVFSELTQSEGIINYKINRQKMVVSYVKSNVTDITYISIVPAKVFMKDSNYVLRLVYLGSFITLIIGITLIYFFTRKNYRPIRELVGILSKKAPAKLNEDVDEYAFIRELIARTLVEKEKIDKELDEHKDIIEEHILMQLVNGHWNKDAEELCKANNISFPEEYFSIILIRLEDYSHLFFEDNQDNMGEALKITHFILKNVLTELISQNYKCYMASSRETLICIVNISEESVDESKDKLLGIVNNAKQFIEKEIGISFSVAIGSPHKQLDGITVSYREAQDAHEYNGILGKRAFVVHYNDIKSMLSETDSINYTTFEEQQFVNCLKVGDFSRARDVLDNIFNKNFTHGVNSVHMMKCRMFGLIFTMISALGEIARGHEQSLLEDLNIVKRLLGCDTVIMLQEEMQKIIDETDAYIGSIKCDREKGMINDIIDFIDKNYSNMDLNVSMIADQYNVSVAYLSKFFKKSVGEGLLFYIHKVRTEKAKKLLEETDYNVKEIAEMVGYYNSDSFIRTFKKYMGVTPGKYKELA